MKSISHSQRYCRSPYTCIKTFCPFPGMIPLDVMETYVPTHKKNSHFKTTVEVGKELRIKQTKSKEAISKLLLSKFLFGQKYPT